MGFGAKPPSPKWPGGAKVVRIGLLRLFLFLRILSSASIGGMTHSSPFSLQALNFVINYEEGGEKCLLHGDNESESLLSEIVGAQPLEGERHANMESLYDYGSRAGFWRLHRVFTSKKVPCTVFAVGMVGVVCWAYFHPCRYISVILTRIYGRPWSAILQFAMR